MAFTGSILAAISENAFESETGSGMTSACAFCSPALTPPETIVPMTTPIVRVATIKVR